MRWECIRRLASLQAGDHDHGGHYRFHPMFASDLLVMGALMGSDVRLTGPAESQPPKDVVELASDIARRAGARITVTGDPAEAVSGADFIHTDVWVPMGESKDVWAQRVKLPRMKRRVHNRRPESLTSTTCCSAWSARSGGGATPCRTWSSPCRVLCLPAGLGRIRAWR